MDIAITTTSAEPFAKVVRQVRDGLAAEGFGILSEIDVQAKMKEKLQRDMGPFLILGACAPPLAWDAIHARPEIGVLLPCNVVVSQEDGQVYVRAMEPLAALEMVKDETVARVAAEASARLHRVIDALAVRPVGAPAQDF